LTKNIDDNNYEPIFLESLEAVLTSYSFSFVLLQCLLLALYRIVLPVLILIHWGMGLFCLPFLARMRFTLKVFKADMGLTRCSESFEALVRGQFDFLHRQN